MTSENQSTQPTQTAAVKPQMSPVHARELLHCWIERERREYADVKFAEGGENRNHLVSLMQETDSFPEFWTDFALNYVIRATLFGPDTLKGRQAMGKAIVTLMHILETSMCLYGQMPKAGMSSTDGAIPCD